MFLHESVRVQLGMTLLAFVGAGVLRRGKPSARVLDIADAVLITTICLGWAMMILCGDRDFPRAELVALLASSYTLAARAALVPSSPARTAIVGAFSLVPIVPVTFHLNQYGEDRFALGPAVYVVIWSLVCVACTTTISHVIYGLRMEVRRAMQLGQYLLEDKIGEGGMGTVYRASHAMLRRPTAIKLLSGTNAQAAERFEREVQITAGLTHPNTVAVFDYGRTPDGVFYYAMEYLEGISLEDLVEEHGAQPVRRVVHILCQMCGALEEAHAADLVHRDIKPANIWLRLPLQGGVRFDPAAHRDPARAQPLSTVVIDFGMVRAIRVSAEVGGRFVAGTAGYIAPEQVLDPVELDVRSDVYALAGTIYNVTTGRAFFDDVENQRDRIIAHMRRDPFEDPERLRGYPVAIAKLLRAATAKEPKDRPNPLEFGREFSASL